MICRVRHPWLFVHEAPVAPGPHTVKRTSRRGGGGLGNLSLHLSIVIFISFILTSSSFSFMLSVFVSFSSVPFCSYYILPYLIWAPCCAIFVFAAPPLYLPCFSSVFEVISPGFPLSPPSELCRLSISCFLSANSPSSSSSATEMAPSPSCMIPCVSHVPGPPRPPRFVFLLFFFQVVCESEAL